MTTTNLTTTEQTILTIITNEPNITPYLIRTTIQRQGTTLTKKQLQKTLETLTEKNLIKTKTQTLAGNQYTGYTIA